MRDLLHQLFGTHVPDPAHNHWDRGNFASICTHCGRAMVRLPAFRGAWSERNSTDLKAGSHGPVRRTIAHRSN